MFPNIVTIKLNTLLFAQNTNKYSNEPKAGNSPLLYAPPTIPKVNVCIITGQYCIINIKIIMPSTSNDILDKYTSSGLLINSLIMLLNKAIKL